MYNTRVIPRSFICIIFMLGCVGTAIQTANAKSGSPISVSIQATGLPGDDQGMDFIVTASSLINTRRLIVNVQPPRGMVLNDGELSWRGAVDRGEKVTLRFNASFPVEAQQTIRATAATQSATGARFAARATYVVGKPLQKSQSAKTAQVRSRDRFRGGRAISEFPLSRTPGKTGSRKGSNTLNTQFFNPEP